MMIEADYGTKKRIELKSGGVELSNTPTQRVDKSVYTPADFEKYTCKNICRRTLRFCKKKHRKK